MSDHEPISKAFQNFTRFHAPHIHLNSPFGNGWFGNKAEGFARFFGTPIFLIGQTAIVCVWIAINLAGLTQFDPYPFILLNLAFSLQAAYAAPLILLAQTRQADRDKAHLEADAHHREAIAQVSEERQTLMKEQTDLLVIMLRQNTELTETIKIISEKLARLTADVHEKLILGEPVPPN